MTNTQITRAIEKLDEYPMQSQVAYGRDAITADNVVTLRQLREIILSMKEPEQGRCGKEGGFGVGASMKKPEERLCTCPDDEEPHIHHVPEEKPCPHHTKIHSSKGDTIITTCADCGYTEAVSDGGKSVTLMHCNLSTIQIDRKVAEDKCCGESYCMTHERHNCDICINQDYKKFDKCNYSLLTEQINDCDFCVKEEPNNTKTIQIDRKIAEKFLEDDMYMSQMIEEIRKALGR
jgi:hypothetical protein